MKLTASRFKLLGDEARLRTLRLLQEERLNVGELTSILGIAQSGVSRHLKLLKNAGLVEEERMGGYAYFRAGQAPELTLVRGLSTRADDRVRLREVLRHRREDFREEGTEERQLVPGRSWAAWARALGHLLPSLLVADLGCGQGYLTIEIAKWARRVFAVDRSKRMLDQAARLASRLKVSNITFRRGEIEKLPMPNSSVDVALLSQALHHAKDPARAVREAARILAPEGTLLILDLDEHEEHWVRTRLGDKWLGFKDRSLRRWLRQAGLDRVRAETGARRRGDPFKVLIVSGRKPSKKNRI